MNFGDPASIPKSVGSGRVCTDKHEANRLAPPDDVNSPIRGSLPSDTFVGVLRFQYKVDEGLEGGTLR